MTADAATLSQLRILILSPADPSNSAPSPFPAILKYLTSIAPSEDIRFFAGYTNHAPVRLRTRYYNKDASIWCDELPSTVGATPQKNPSLEASDISHTEQSTQGTSGDLDEWKEQMLSAAAREVRAVIGGIILILPTNSAPHTSDTMIKYIEAVHALREAVEDDAPGRDVAAAIVLQPQTMPTARQSNAPSILRDFATLADSLSSECIEHDMLGWDIVHWLGVEDPEATVRPQTSERNEFGEKIGIDRVMEVLESVDWSADPGPIDEAEDDEVAPDATSVLNRESLRGLDDELQREMLDLKLSMMEQQSADDDDGDDGDGEDLSIEQMEQLQGRILAIREAASGMSGSQKEAFAQREIDKIMKEL